MKPSTQRLLRTLRDAGATGLHSFELRDPVFGGHIDAPKRVSEARQAGYEIEARDEVLHGHRGKRYVLRRERSEPEPQPEPTVGGLFDAERFRALPPHDTEAA